MARLPNIESRVDPGLGRSGFLRAGARPAPVADVAEGLERAAAGLNAYAQAGSRVQEREDAISRVAISDGFFERASEEYRARLTAGGFRRSEDVRAFRDWLDNQSETMLGQHRGSPDSEARLRQEIIGLRGNLARQAAGAAVAAQKAEIDASLSRRVNALAETVVKNPASITEAFGELGGIIDSMADALTPEEETETRAATRTAITAAAIEGKLDMADTRGALEILAVPGVAESLDPQKQAYFASRISDLRRDQEERSNARLRKLEDAAFALGTTVDQLPLWARVQAVGLQLPSGSKAQSPIGKVLEDRRMFVEQFGEDSPQVRALDDSLRREANGDPPSLSDVGSVRSQFLGQAKEFVSVRDSYRRVEAARRDVTPAGDFALIFNYAKILDPGSVVRESEFEAIARQGGFGTKVMTWLNMSATGTLTPQVRNEIANQARAQMEEQLEAHRQLEEQFRGIAQRNGIDPRDVVVDLVTDFRPRRPVDYGDAGEGEATGGEPPPPAARRPSSPTGNGLRRYDMQGNPILGGQ